MAYANQAMTSTDLVNSLMTYIWSRFIPAFRARGFPRQGVLDVSEAVATTGQSVKVTVGQVMPSSLLSDGNTRVLTDLPPLVADVTLTQDRYVAFGLTQLVSAFIAGQATLPALIDAALSGLLNDMEIDIIANVVANAPNSVGSFGTPITAATLISAFTTLVNNYMPQETYHGLLAPTAGAVTPFAQISNIVYAQERGSNRAGAGSELSLSAAPPESIMQDVSYMGGLWSASQLVPAPTVSGAVQASNIVWHPKALAVAMRPMPIPTSGIGAVARNFVKGDVAIQMLQQWNINTQSEELVLKVLYGMAAAQPAWSCKVLSN